MNSMKLEYTDGRSRFLGQLYWDDARSGKRPGVLVFPEAFGLNDHARQRAQQLARQGYVALAADLHGDGRVIDDFSNLAPAIQPLLTDRALWRARARAAFDALQAQSLVDAGSMAAIGFCFGGSTCLELARTGVPLAAIVTFHASLVTELPEDAGKIRSNVLFCQGAEDPLVKSEVVDSVLAALRRDRIDWQLIQYGNTVHSFTSVEADARGMPGFAYSALADKRSWQAMTGLFDEVFG